MIVWNQDLREIKGRGPFEVNLARNQGIYEEIPGILMEE
jgi:hypothetical protein